jgi:UDP-N-acetylmuramoyl-tripeptide--D-alanyl-D-alanine ligase
MMSLAILAEVLQAPLIGRDALFTGVSTDTRTLNRGDLFVAIQGPRYDGHTFLAEAIRAGASGALLARTLDTTLPHVRVDDTRLALGRMAAFWRAQFDIPVIAVTGSNGKTTVKEMIAAILARKGPVCATRGNLNNDIGLPLTLCRLTAQDRYAVIEMGMNHKGEIDYLTRLTRPTQAVITNAGAAHLAGLGTIEDVARAKGEIFAGLVPDGVAVINADDAHSALWKKLAAPRTIRTFGIERLADYRAEYALGMAGTEMFLKSPNDGIEVKLPLLGRHNVLNALAAAAAAATAGATLDDIKRGLEIVRPVAGRLEPKAGLSGARVIDDTYNANPDSLAAALALLREFKGERVLVLGDMGELGENAAELHRRAGDLAREMGIQRVYGLGELSRNTVATFGKGARHFDSVEALIEALIDCMHGEMTVLVKGSRAARMERVVSGIQRVGTSRQKLTEA